MKKVGKCSDLYTSRGPVRHRLKTRRTKKTAVDVCVRTWRQVSATSFDGWGQIDQIRQRLPSKCALKHSLVR